MKEKNRVLTETFLKKQFKNQFPHINSLALESLNEKKFRDKLSSYLHSIENKSSAAVEHLQRLINYDGQNIYELSTEKRIEIKTITWLWLFLTGQTIKENISIDFWIDLYHQFNRLYTSENKKPSKKQILKWMKRWNSGLDYDVSAIRKKNKERIISLLIRKIELRHSPHSRYVFPLDCTEEEKYDLLNKWWEEARFHLALAIKSPRELNRMLNNSLSEETMELYQKARKKGMPIFVTPYYLSLLNPNEDGYDDSAIRSYILYSSHLIEAYGNIRAWEKEDTVEAGKPNAAGWLLPDGRNIHRRYPEVAILIPDSMGRACGGLCASCQRMYDFQSERLNFNFEELKPRESWDKRLRKLMDYFENDTQLRDILITGGDALMSQNKTLNNILEAVYKMAVRKRKANLVRKEGEKYAEIQRVRLGTRLPVYLPMRITDDLIQILQDFKEKASTAGVRQFVIQTHFQSPLEVTPKAHAAIEKLLKAGWTVTNQLVYNVAASRRGHTAKLREVLNDIGVLCYYTFSVKGFDENYSVFTPNCRSIQEEKEEKHIGKLDQTTEKEFLSLLENSSDQTTCIHNFCVQKKVPFVSTDRNVLNLPGIGKSMTFFTVGISREGKRILQFDHDHTRKHSPVIDHIEKVFIEENKSVYQYILQLEAMGENPNDYTGLWRYTEGRTEPCFPLYAYPDTKFIYTDKLSNIDNP